MRLMQDDKTSHTAYTTHLQGHRVNVLQAHRVNVLPWPSKKPYFNPVAHILDVIGRVIRRRALQYKTIRETLRWIAQRKCLSYTCVAQSLASRHPSGWRSYQVSSHMIFCDD